MSDSGIYQIRNVVNGKIYIGGALSISHRWSHHRSLLNHRKHHSVHLQNAWNKYGEKAFIFEVLELCPKELLRCVEQDFLDDLNPDYNQSKLSTGGNGGANKGKAPWHKGKQLSDVHRKRISLALTGIKRSPEHIEKIASAKRGKPSWAKGKTFSDEYRQKLSLAHIGKPSSRKGVHLTNETKIKLSTAIKEWWKKRRSNKP